MPWTFYNSSGQRLSTAATNISVLDIDGATDIGAAIVDADLFIVDDGAGGTNRKTAASRLVTYVMGDGSANVNLGSNLLVGNGGSTGIAISANGEVNMAAQPAFLAYNASTVTNITGDGGVYTGVFGTEVYDLGGDFDGTSTFTAPVTGKYHFIINVNMNGITAAGDFAMISLVTPNRTHRWQRSATNNLPLAINTYSFTVYADMDSGEAATVQIDFRGESSDVVDFVGDGYPLTFFSGMLVA